ncbi:N-acetylmuramoyl-L-alanine amidase, partial [Adlercreutzia agrestimuris]|uniref:N-acetylmuramoyl-L-alanine amidase n=1 Tax=Adlercreutzia agrestimuris TaxID=2941324 RepID=UPI00203F37E6
MSQSLAKFARSCISVVLAGALVFSCPVQGFASERAGEENDEVLSFAYESDYKDGAIDDQLLGSPETDDQAAGGAFDEGAVGEESDSPAVDGQLLDEPQDSLQAPSSNQESSEQDASESVVTDEIVELTDDVVAQSGVYEAFESADDAAEKAELSPGFVYFDNETISLGQEQLIALIVDDESYEVASARLAYESAAGAQKIIEATTCAENAALFSIVPHELGIYTLLEAEFTNTQGEVSLMNFRPQTDEDGPCVFLVSEPAAGVEALAELGDEADVSVYAFDSEADAVVEAPSLDVAASVADEALVAGDAVTSGARMQGQAMAASPIQSKAGEESGALFQVASPALEKAKRGETLVIALDPGHGGYDGGANDSIVSGIATVQEKNVTLKIAKYCKAALERYNVRVYMTRTTDEYVGLSERVRRAKNAGADVFISIHINSAASTLGNGAEVWYPNSSSYRHDLHEEGKQLAGNIVKKLAALGLQNRGIKTLNATNGYTYPNNGGIGDYYTVIADARESGMAGLIVEHAFISNPSESAKLKQESFLKQLGEADAAGIVDTYGLRVGWEQVNGKWRLLLGDGTYAKNCWQKVNGEMYWFDNDTYAATGWRTISNKKYYFSSTTCAMLKGWQKIGGKWYYFLNSSGAMHTGWLSLNGVKYYLDPSSGVMVTGQKKIDGKVYTFDASGKLQVNAKTGWNKIDGKWYYYQSNGAAKTGWLQLGSSWYWLDLNSGEMAEGKLKINGKWYYFTPGSGAMRSYSWLKLNNVWYWADSSGAFRENAWLQLGATWYYLKSDGVMATGWEKVNGKWYYFNPSNGAMRTY